MKKHTLILLSLLIVTSCKKKNEPKPTPQPVLLTAIKYVLPGIPDTLVTNYVYKYNVNDKLTDINLGGTDYPLLYNTSGQLISYGGVSKGGIFMQFKYDQNSNPLNSTTTTYDELGQPETDANYAYTISNGRVSQIEEVASLGGAVLEKYNYMYDSVGNIIEEDIINSDGSVRETNTYTFGNHYSPFYTDHIKMSLSPDLDNNYFNKNEILTQTSTNSLGTTQFTFTYTYKGLYPTSLVIGVGNVKNYYYYTYSGLLN